MHHWLQCLHTTSQHPEHPVDSVSSHAPTHQDKPLCKDISIIYDLNQICHLHHTQKRAARLAAPLRHQICSCSGGGPRSCSRRNATSLWRLRTWTCACRFQFASRIVTPWFKIGFVILSGKLSPHSSAYSTLPNMRRSNSHAPCLYVFHGFSTSAFNIQMRSMGNLLLIKLSHMSKCSIKA